MPQRTRAILTAAACALACLGVWGCGSSDNGDDGGGGPGPDRSIYVGETVCAGCHAELTEHWEATNHAEAVATLAAIGQDGNTRCLGCHTTGMGKEGGFVDAATTPHLLNVQCESCHGPGAAHVANPSEDNITRLVKSETCGACHTDAHHPTYDEFLESKHSVSLKDAHNDNCVECHSGEGFVHHINNPTAPPEEERRQVGEEATTNVECFTCHNLHPEEDNEAQLRLPVTQLCRECHTFRVERRVPGTRVHNPQGEILNGNGGFSWDGKTYQPLPLPSIPVTHAAATGGDCSYCHVWRVEVEDPNEGNPNVTGHSFRPNLNACAQTGCHVNLARQAQEPPPLTGDAITEGAPQAVIDLYNASRAETLALLKQTKTALDNINLPVLTVAQKVGYDVVKWNYDMCNADKSEGIHNKQYVHLMLETALDIAAQLPQKP